MLSFLTIFCRSHQFFSLAAILNCSIFSLPHPVAAQPPAYLGRDAQGRQLFRIGSLTAALSVGDRLGPCVVNEKGLDCPPSVDPTSDAKAASAKADCNDLLQKQEEKFQARYLQSLEEYTENLRRKNYELVEKSRQLQELRTRLDKEENKNSTSDGLQNRDPLDKSD
ncbi:MAG: hypothetical protein P8130_05130 [Deltaproteobacteria bacterium]